MRNWEKYIRKVEPYVPGEQPKDVNVVKLNTNENPYPPTPKALEAVWDFAYDRVGYLGTNTPIDKCYKCDFEGDFTPTERGFMCPNCGNTDPKTVDVVKRTCGYLGNPQARPMVKGRHKEISARVKHMNGSTIKYGGKHL